METPNPPSSATTTPATLPAWLTPPEAAAVLRVSVDTVYRACRNGQLPHQRLGRQIRIPRSAVAGPETTSPESETERS
jgi:excisionase family DNA binding protein